MPTLSYEVTFSVLFRQRASGIVAPDPDTTFAQGWLLAGYERRFFSIVWGMEVKRFAIVGAGLLSIAGFVGAASGADLPARTYTKSPAVVAPVYDWSGFYIGLNGGGASSRECWTITSNAGFALVPTPSEGCHSTTGGMVGGQVGYRWQTANWVFGVEAQGDWANLTGSNASLTVLIPATNRTKIDGIGLSTG